MSWGGGEANAIIQNRLNYFKKIGLAIARAVFADQVHGTEIRRIEAADAGRGKFEAEDRIPATDGLLMHIPGLILTTLHADCAPIFYADPEHKAIGLAHAGWRGILAGMPGKMLATMENEFGSKRREIQVVVGPMIGTSSYEVAPDLAERFVQRFGPQVATESGGKPHLDLFAAIVANLLENNLEPNKIPARPACTACDQVYASFRRDGAPPRSMLAWLEIKA